MSKELVINSTSGKVEIALLENGQLVELHRDQGSNGYAVGDIFLGRVRKVLPSLNAAFVDVGHERDAFLHYLDLGPHYRTQQRYAKRVMQGKQPVPDLGNFTKDPEIDKKGKIKDEVSASQLVLVQVAKEPISSKGPRLTAEVTLPGRYIVLVPFSDKVSLSGRIKSETERKRLKRLMMSIRPPGFGIIIRTVAEDKGAADLHTDLEDLVKRWGEMHKKLRNAKPGKRVLGELNKTNAVLRDVLTSDCTSIRVNDERIGDEIKTYLQGIRSDKGDIVKVSRDRDLFNTLSIHRQIKAAFGKQVNLKSGAYLIIEQTEAMHVIDVNSGGRKAGAKDQEENALQTNLECCKEIARVLRLRDMGGIICIDFIDMAKREHNKELLTALKEAMKSDKAKHNILAPSRFGVVEMTRQRVRPVAEVKTSEKCPTCDGTGNVQASILITDSIESAIHQITSKGSHQRLTVMLHPIIEAYVKQGWWNNLHRQWQRNYGIKLHIESNSSMELLESHFYNNDGEEIEVNPRSTP
ncbi:MAG: Rne/Rng family ribonuclease [Bacteroidetes bacterium]|nr:Rne/Rng family ribonuclease [Bacteroidota bacterium]